MQDTKHIMMPDWYVALREKAAVDFATLSDPSFKYGLNIFFTPGTISIPHSLAGGTGKASGIAVREAQPEERAVLSSHLSDSGNLTGSHPHVRAPENVSVMSLSAAIHDPRFADIVRERLTAVSSDKIDAWLLSTLDDGLFVHVPQGVTATSPVRIDRRLTLAETAECVIVLAEKGSTVTVVEHLASEGTTPKLRAARTDIVVRPEAQVTHVSVQDFGNTVTSFDAKRAAVEKDGSMTWIDCAFGGDYVRSRVTTELVGEGASTRVMSMCFADEQRRLDIRHDVRHAASHTTSDIRTKNALTEHSKAIYRGLVAIEPQARGCNGRQKEDTLLLSPDAEIDAMPDLEIGTGDVRAGHSASIGGLDKEKLFYLMSRGLNRTDATRTLIEGFFAPVVDDMRDSGLEDMVHCLIAARMEKTATLSEKTS